MPIAVESIGKLQIAGLKATMRSPKLTDLSFEDRFDPNGDPHSDKSQVLGVFFSSSF